MDASRNRSKNYIFSILTALVLAASIISANGEQQQQQTIEGYIVKSRHQSLTSKTIVGSQPKKFREIIETAKQKQLQQQLQLSLMVHDENIKGKFSNSFQGSENFIQQQQPAAPDKTHSRATTSGSGGVGLVVQRRLSSNLFKEDETIDHQPPPTTVHGLVEGMAGVDFPGLTRVPSVTRFRCNDIPHEPGMYADVSTGCQVYHLCFDGRQESFVCGLGTIFNQANLVCDYWHQVDCSKSSKYFNSNLGFGKSTMPVASSVGPSRQQRPVNGPGGFTIKKPGKKQHPLGLQSLQQTTTSSRFPFSFGVPNLQAGSIVVASRKTGKLSSTPKIDIQGREDNRLAGIVGSGSGNSLKNTITTSKGLTSTAAAAATTKITNSTETTTRAPSSLSSNNLPASKTSPEFQDGPKLASDGQNKEATAEAEDKHNTDSGTSGTNTTTATATATVVSTPSSAISTENNLEESNSGAGSPLDSNPESTTQNPPTSIQTSPLPADSKTKVDPPVATKAPDSTTSSTNSSTARRQQPITTRAPDSTMNQEEEQEEQQQQSSITVEDDSEDE